MEKYPYVVMLWPRVDAPDQTIKVVSRHTYCDNARKSMRKALRKALPGQGVSIEANHGNGPKMLFCDTK